jgi:YegS/Rv2252/BmrU family lipid kinase
MKREKSELIIIANPVSGARHLNPDEFRTAVSRMLDTRQFNYEIHLTLRAGHAGDIARNGLNKGVSLFLVAGGDGTINEVAAVLKGTDATMGILPGGSGNGLAHHLGIPIQLHEALSVFNQQCIERIDTCTVNGKLFVSIAGIGFDARVARQFAKNDKRGFLTYAKIVFHEYYNYKPRKFKLIFNGKTLSLKAFFISFANSSQFGYNTRIAPSASLTDGLIDICVVQKPPIRALPSVAHQLFRRKAERSKYLKIYQADSLVVKRMKGRTVNIDGEPVKMDRELLIKVAPSSLNIVVPSKNSKHDS